MKIKTESLPEVFETVYKLLEEKNYAVKTLNDHRHTYNQLKAYLDKRAIAYYTEEIGIGFINQHYGKKAKPTRKSNRSGKAQYRLYIKRLSEAYKNASLNVRRENDPAKELDHLSESLDIYRKMQQERPLCAKTIENKCFKVKNFFLYLEHNGVHDVSCITTKTVYKYLDDKKAVAVSTKEGLLYVLRDLFKSFYEIGLCKEPLAALFPQISTHSESPVPSHFTPAEIKKILCSVDRRSATGKRDYVILLLSSLLGIRTGDIRVMKFGNIKWDTDTVEFTQSKTKKHLQLPMPYELKLALLDYLKNARPKNRSDNLFVKMKAPYEPYGPSTTFGHILQKYLGGIDVNGRKKGLHSLRFSAAGNMLAEGVNMISICNILGHSCCGTTNQYLKIDISQLRKAALEVSE